MKRYGSIIKVKPDRYEEYERLHANPWPEVNRKIKECNISNYSIYYKDGYLFSYFEYDGEDYISDMAKMAEDQTTQEWWDLCKPCMTPLETRGEGEWWAEMKEIYHLD